ncbi:TPA: phage late control D family protein [Yersinia enterocolitica]|uniref:phage late control D family protein n=1 Tax=Yersinia enterocolitica TaxID=630 RepID=UPI001C8DB7C0|nr:phage late control D family protein [Yersinia enterocolitica]EKN6364498.1 phage late control D family protein [Yersinia enterocolitica]ELI8163171.1 phage late control D family protein [Yersinia enterocolitica]MBX9480052.1 phage late control D family protein [Yersinia enterocolitica]HEB2007877.1 phage late control D family protein [Yersinia enterocolitica]HEG1706678.1 phage late control D family protein [Yersinia enterocolitica]
MMAGLPLSAEADLAPDFMLTINQKDITQNIRDRLLSLSLTDNRGFEADQLDIELDDADGQLTMPERGAVLSVFLGWKGASLMGKGDFIVDEVEHHGAPDTLTIRARSADFRGSLNARREVSYHATTLGNVVAQVAERNNLQAMLAEGLADITIPHIDQTQETDAKFITRLASLNGAVAAVKAGRLLFIKPGSAVTASGKPIPQMTITRQDGDQHSFSIADRGAYTGVSASWLHTKKPKPKKVKLQRKPQFKLLRALQHPKIKAPQKSQSVEERRGDYLAGSGDNVFAITTVYATQKAAMRAAQAKWEKLQRGVAEFSITLAMGRADLFPETPIMVSGFKSVIDQQKWIISKVTHHLNNSGYTTQLVLEVLLSDVTYHVTA